MLLFNTEHGFMEAIVRGYRLGIINSTQYNNFCQYLKVQLNGTEYGELTHSLPSPITTSILSATLRRNFVEEFRYLQANATGALSHFLAYLTYEYQIDNVVFLITAMLHESATTEELIERCHPLGLFEALPALTVARNVEELYNTVLVETPLAPYFKECLKAKDLDDFNVEIIRNTLHRAYLEDFNRFCGQCDSTTAEVMGMVLAHEADRRTLNVIINSLGTSIPRETKIALLPKFGRLHELGVSLKLANAEELTQVKSIVEAECPEYRQLLDAAMSNQKDDGKMNMTASTLDAGVRSLEEYFFEREVSMCKDAMLYQFSMCPFYAWVKLKEQEIRNIVWIAECIAQQQKENIHHFIPIY
ncbi:ATP synthase (C/AC39) subunit [Paramicrosporidium saccamoebae]|uniref:V-type proton ATPase subunit n=1 Tax=Paramicrosporidium saccamoebae TaxID=1246581 RepID=A0A2H9THW5_9FUNG|nr:ATP synthase (C/AC39) subunit [Paramicrosporidium saccamoebae]